MINTCKITKKTGSFFKKNELECLEKSKNDRLGQLFDIAVIIRQIYADLCDKIALYVDK